MGVVPAWQATSGTLHDELKEGTRGNSGVRSIARNVLVVAQVALAVVSLVGAALFVRTFVNLETYDIGFNPAPLTTLRIVMPEETYGAPEEILPGRGIRAGRRAATGCRRAGST